MVLDLRLVWTPMPQVTEQGLHGAQLQSLRGKNISTFLPIASDDHLLCKLWQRRTVECEMKESEESGKDGWAWSDDWLACDPGVAALE